MRIISYEEAGKQVKIGEEEERDKGGECIPLLWTPLKSHSSVFLKVMFSGVGVEKMFNIR